MSGLICPDFDEFEEALYGVAGRYVLRTRQQRNWRLEVVDLDGVALMFGCEGAGTVYSGIGLSGFFNIFLPLSRHESTVVDGKRMHRHRLGWMVPEAMFHIDAMQPGSWMTVAMSCELVLAWAQLHEDEFDPSILLRNLVVVAQYDLKPLISLALRLRRIDQQVPAQLDAPQAKQAARQEMLDLVFHSMFPLRRAQASQAGHQRILRQALELLEMAQDSPIHVSDLCRATHASERTLRNVFTRYLGVSPHRYLMTHRLQAIRRAMLRAAPDTTISEICGMYGVWDFGRFAGLYQNYFGELPSQTRRHRYAPQADVALPD
ncbi:helix-turn-helix domain-containing protein [Pseudomonas asiatica]|uniref:helix-turn-helix domain-containing protein n=1 Tax=Pseudomonas asiatica TaxID=2219225 RepID=UPI002DB8CDFE|nr:helix-turn-helix domain-containing protein [Pseudomonas asiatica]MEB6592190.1 helix-turn-helix domain-containing protein [Pseudomonas asiatica]